VRAHALVEIGATTPAEIGCSHRLLDEDYRPHCTQDGSERKAAGSPMKSPDHDPSPLCLDDAFFANRLSLLEIPLFPRLLALEILSPSNFGLRYRSIWRAMTFS